MAIECRCYDLMVEHNVAVLLPGKYMSACEACRNDKPFGPERHLGRNDNEKLDGFENINFDICNDNIGPLIGNFGNDNNWQRTVTTTSGTTTIRFDRIDIGNDNKRQRTM